MSGLQHVLIGWIYLIIYIVIFIGFMVSICYPHFSTIQSYRYRQKTSFPFTVSLAFALMIEALHACIMIQIAVFMHYRRLTMFAFYHFIILTLPYYKTYLLLKESKWLQLSTLSSFVLLQSDYSRHDILNRLYCALHHMAYHKGYVL